MLNQECYFFLLSVIIIVIKKINFHLKLMAELQIHLVLDCFLRYSAVLFAYIVAPMGLDFKLSFNLRIQF